MESSHSLGRLGAGALTVLTGTLLSLGACDDSGTSAPPPQKKPPEAHADVVLRDVSGAPLTAASKQPYSPRATCGRCHDVDAIARGYHFQQGRADSTGKVDPRLIEPWTPRVAVLSPGMFGKW